MAASRTKSARKTDPEGDTEREIRFGLVGLGFMGLTHLRALRTAKGARLVAIATKDPKKAGGDFSEVRGNFGASGGAEDLSGVRVHTSLEEMLRDPDVDVVDLCLPSYLHAETSIEALAAGKHVLVEKPIALRSSDAKRMLAAAKKAERLLLVGQVLKFFPEFRLLIDAVADRRWGALRALHLRRIIAMPDWSGDSWFSDPKKSGGMLVDLHIHDTDFVVGLLGRPQGVRAGGLRDGRGVHFVRTLYDYGPKGPLVSSEGGWLNAPALPFEHGYDAYFEKATLVYNSSTAPKPRLYETGDKPTTLTLKGADGFVAELEAAARSVRSGTADAGLAAASAALSLRVIDAESKSVKSGAPVEIPEKG